MASAALVTVSYSVLPGKHGEFQSLIQSIVQRVNSANSGVQMSIYQADSSDHDYVEVYECASSDAYDSLEDTLDEETLNMLNKIASDFVTARQSFTTLKKVAG